MGITAVNSFFLQYSTTVMTPLFRKLTNVQKHYLDNSHTEFNKNTKNGLATGTSHGQTDGYGLRLEGRDRHTKRSFLLREVRLK
jgi:hypothetical protein